MKGRVGKIIAMLIQYGNLSKRELILFENCKICKKIVDVRCVKVERNKKRRKREYKMIIGNT